MSRRSTSGSDGGGSPPRREEPGGETASCGEAKPDDGGSPSRREEPGGQEGDDLKRRRVEKRKHEFRDFVGRWKCNGIDMLVRDNGKLEYKEGDAYRQGGIFVSPGDGFGKWFTDNGQSFTAVEVSAGRVIWQSDSETSDVMWEWERSDAVHSGPASSSSASSIHQDRSAGGSLRSGAPVSSIVPRAKSAAATAPAKKSTLTSVKVVFHCFLSSAWDFDPAAEDVEVWMPDVDGGKRTLLQTKRIADDMFEVTGTGTVPQDGGICLYRYQVRTKANLKDYAPEIVAGEKGLWRALQAPSSGGEKQVAMRDPVVVPSNSEGAVMELYWLAIKKRISPLLANSMGSGRTLTSFEAVQNLMERIMKIYDQSIFRPQRIKSRSARVSARMSGMRFPAETIAEWIDQLMDRHCVVVDVGVADAEPFVFFHAIVFLAMLGFLEAKPAKSDRFIAVLKGFSTPISRMTDLAADVNAGSSDIWQYIVAAWRRVLNHSSFNALHTTRGLYFLHLLDPQVSDDVRDMRNLQRWLGIEGMPNLEGAFEAVNLAQWSALNKRVLVGILADDVFLRRMCLFFAGNEFEDILTRGSAMGFAPAEAVAALVMKMQCVRDKQKQRSFFGKIGDFLSGGAQVPEFEPLTTKIARTLAHLDLTDEAVSSAARRAVELYFDECRAWHAKDSKLHDITTVAVPRFKIFCHIGLVYCRISDDDCDFLVQRLWDLMQAWLFPIDMLSIGFWHALAEFNDNSLYRTCLSTLLQRVLRTNFHTDEPRTLLQRYTQTNWTSFHGTWVEEQWGLAIAERLGNLSSNMLEEVIRQVFPNTGTSSSFSLRPLGRVVSDLILHKNIGGQRGTTNVVIAILRSSVSSLSPSQWRLFFRCYCENECLSAEATQDIHNLLTDLDHLLSALQTGEISVADLAVCRRNLRQLLTLLTILKAYPNALGVGDESTEVIKAVLFRVGVDSVVGNDVVCNVPDPAVEEDINDFLTAREKERDAYSECCETMGAVDEMPANLAGRPKILASVKKHLFGTGGADGRWILDAQPIGELVRLVRDDAVFTTTVSQCREFIWNFGEKFANGTISVHTAVAELPENFAHTRFFDLFCTRNKVDLDIVAHRLDQIRQCRSLGADLLQPLAALKEILRKLILAPNVGQDESDDASPTDPDHDVVPVEVVSIGKAIEDFTVVAETRVADFVTDRVLLVLKILALIGSGEDQLGLLSAIVSAADIVQWWRKELPR